MIGTVVLSFLHTPLTSDHTGHDLRIWVPLENRGWKWLSFGAPSVHGDNLRGSLDIWQNYGGTAEANEATGDYVVHCDHAFAGHNWRAFFFWANTIGQVGRKD